jgi:GNAT superfamily N-acetyltransferase
LPSPAEAIPGASIGVAERSHVPVLLSLLEELFTQERDFKPNAQKQVLGLLQIIDHPECGRIFIARHHNAVIGMATVLCTISTAEGGPVLLLEDVIVARPYRGQGVGGLLMRHILCWAQANGYLRVTLLTDPDNTDALRFYEHHGFARSGMAVLRQNPVTAYHDDAGDCNHTET